MAILSKFASSAPFVLIILGCCIVKPLSIVYVIPLCLLVYGWKLYSSRLVPVLKSGKKSKFPLEEKIVLNHNVAILPSPRHVLGLPIGNHISVCGDIDGKQIWRSYTPITADTDHGHFALLIKSYPTGNVSQWFAKMQVGDFIEIVGPKGNFNYKAGMVGTLCMIAGGTGITPMLQIIRAIVENPDDFTQVILIYANVAVEDIILKEELDELVSKHDQLKVFYVLDHPPEGWSQGSGFISRDMIQALFPRPNPDMKILICGPPAMVSAMKKLTNNLGYDSPRPVPGIADQVFCF